jgi:hypothetical protein
MIKAAPAALSLRLALRARLSLYTSPRLRFSLRSPLCHRASLHASLRALAPLAVILILAVASLAQQNEQKPTDQKPVDPAQPTTADTPPVQHADDLKTKVTFSVYGLSDDVNVDVNLRHQFGPVVAWVAGFYDHNGGSKARIGGEYDFQYKWLAITPSLEVGSNGAVAGSISTQMGGRTYAIAGYSRTNLKPFNDLFFDPSEAVTLGAGHKFNDYDKLYGYVIFDVRLHTHQQDTHVLWRHRLNANNGITFDFLYKSGYSDDGAYIRNAGIGVYYDRPRWFWKAYYDPNVNFTHQDMVRFGVGMKF